MQAIKEFLGLDLSERPAMKPLRRPVVFLIYLLALLLIGLMTSNATGQPRWSTPMAEFIKTVHLNDPVSFASGALDIARHGWFTPANYWLIHLWPPGFMVLEGGIMALFGESVGFLRILLLLSAACCATWMLLLRDYLLPYTGHKIATIAPALPFVFPLTSFFLLSPVGLSLGETFSLSFFISAFLLVLLAFRERSLRKAIAAGLLLAAAAYFRSQFELLVLGLTGVGVVILVAAAIVWVREKRHLVAPPTLLVILTSLAAAHLAMAPWRYHNYLDLGQTAWVQTSTLIAKNSLMSEKDLRAAGGEFVIAGGGHLACKLEPTYCGRSDMGSFYSAFFRHMGAWVATKARIIPEYWLSPPAVSALMAPAEPNPWDDAANMVLLMVVLASFWRLYRIRKDPEFAVQAWFQLSLYASLLLVYLLAHIEARYFFLPKIFSMIGLMTLLARSTPRATAPVVAPGPQAGTAPAPVPTIVPVPTAPVAPATPADGIERRQAGADSRPMKAVILAGGLGTRISEESSVRPKPMIEVGGKPILWHIMKMYSAHGINDFIVCCGYKGYVIKEYFANYFLHMSDVTFDMKDNQMHVHQANAENWRVTLVDTGENTMTGGRLKRVREYLGDEDFCFTYGDGVGDVDIAKSIEFHRAEQRLATLTSVQPPGRFGALNLQEHRVASFEEKPHGDGAWINGGFFVLSPKVIDLIADDTTIWERGPLETLARDGQLSAWLHRGFWQPMDTLRDKNHLEELWQSGKAPWKVWP